MTEGIAAKVEELEKKYFDLVWFARKIPADYKNERIVACIDEVKRTYPSETRDLANEYEGDWHHGFNSGMLAACRLLRAYIEQDKDEIELAEKEFPFLDT
jgi:hypothetical protein